MNGLSSVCLTHHNRLSLLFHPLFHPHQHTHADTFASTIVFQQQLFVGRVWVDVSHHHYHHPSPFPSFSPLFTSLLALPLFFFSYNNSQRRPLHIPYYALFFIHTLFYSLTLIIQPTATALPLPPSLPPFLVTQNHLLALQSQQLPSFCS
ncbi:hypothetical protein F5H01DRAFT_54215 [Linnemannia elongata]|nr:hypothetical protein F5H01DRAFT_54215 [Linnemannia elongata]